MTVKMDFEFIEDTYNYKKNDGHFLHFQNDDSQNGEMYPSPYSAKSVQNHPMMIMTRERKLDLLQHPLCLALMEHKWKSFGIIPYSIDLLIYILFLTFPTIYVLTSPGPISNPEVLIVLVNISAISQLEAAQTSTSSKIQVGIMSVELASSAYLY